MKDKLIDWGVDYRKIIVVFNVVDINKFKFCFFDDVLQGKWGLNS